MTEAWVARDILSDASVLVQVDGDRVAFTPLESHTRPDGWISPGWLDLQVNGFAGYDVNSPELAVDDLRGITTRLWREGVSAWCPTVITAAPGQIERSLRVIDQASKLDPLVRSCVAGIHLEGPYLSPSEGARGVHPVQYIHPPDWDEFAGWQAAAGGLIRLITLAPELPGAMAFIRSSVDHGLRVALGHTRAATADIHDAVDAGASLSTHLGNGIEALLPRHPNPIWDQLAEDRLSASLIFDGFHLPESMMKVTVRAKGVSGCILISDASALARQSPGIYDTPVGGKVQLDANGRLSMLGTDYLAGSASSLKDGVENAVRLAGCTLTEAIHLVSTNPFRFLNYQQDARTLFTFDPESSQVTIVGVCIGGEIVYRNPSWTA